MRSGKHHEKGQQVVQDQCMMMEKRWVMMKVGTEGTQRVEGSCFTREVRHTRRSGLCSQDWGQLMVEEV